MKANWTPEFHKIFIDLCIEQVGMGNKPGSSLTKDAWNYVMDEFFKRTGVQYDRKQFKNHWDNTRLQWKIWCKLINHTEVEYDPVNQRINASAEFWDIYLRDNRLAGHFRYQGIPLAESLEILFETEDTAAAIQIQNQESACSSQVKVDGVNIITDGRKRKDEGASHIAQRRRVIEYERPNGEVNEPKTSVYDPRSVAAYSRREPYSIKECIDLLNTIPDIGRGSDLYFFAVDLFLRKDYREAFVELGASDLRHGWLQRQQTLGNGQT